MSFFAKIQRAFFLLHSVVGWLSCFTVYSRPLEDVWCLALKNGIFLQNLLHNPC